MQGRSQGLKEVLICSCDQCAQLHMMISDFLALFFSTTDSIHKENLLKGAALARDDFFALL